MLGQSVFLRSCSERGLAKGQALWYRVQVSPQEPERVELCLEHEPFGQVVCSKDSV